MRNNNSIDYDEIFIKNNFKKYTLVELSKILSERQGYEITAKNLSRKINKMGLSKLTKLSDIKLKDDEIFKDIPNFSNYKVSQYGNVVNKKNDTVLTHITDKRGYFTVKLTDGNNKKRNIPLHRLIAFAWLPNPDNKLEVDHIDGDKKNNSLCNLEWVSSRENLKRARIKKLNVSKPTDHHRISDNIVRQIFIKYKNNPKLKYTELAREFGVSPKSVSNIVKGIRHKNLTSNL